MTPRQIALQNNQKFYHGRSCKNGHTKKYTSSRRCVECFGEEYRDRIYDINLEWQKKYRTVNKETVRENNKKWYTSPKGKATMGATTRKRQASKLQRTPNWLTEEDLEIIKQSYQTAVEISEETGIKHVVDHIIPLQGRNVSGLHVPSNIQIISQIKNIKKSNRYEIL
jgi:hypothetical protein